MEKTVDTGYSRPSFMAAAEDFCRRGGIDLYGRAPEDGEAEEETVCDWGDQDDGTQ